MNYLSSGTSCSWSGWFVCWQGDADCCIERRWFLSDYPAGNQPATSNGSRTQMDSELNVCEKDGMFNQKWPVTLYSITVFHKRKPEEWSNWISFQKPRPGGNHTELHMNGRILWAITFHSSLSLLQVLPQRKQKIKIAKPALKDTHLPSTKSSVFSWKLDMLPFERNVPF